MIDQKVLCRVNERPWHLTRYMSEMVMQTSISKSICVSVSHRQQGCCARFVPKWLSAVVIALHWHALPVSRSTVGCSFTALLPCGVHFHQLQAQGQVILSSACCHPPRAVPKDMQQKIGERPCISLWIVKSEFCDKTLGTYCPLTQAIQVLQPVLCHLPSPPWSPCWISPWWSPCACTLAPQSKEEGELGELWSSEKGTSI